MPGAAYVALTLCVAAVQCFVLLVAARYGARKALAKVEANTALTVERVERIEEHLGMHDDEPARQYAIDPEAEFADRSGLFAPRRTGGTDCG